MNDYKNMKVSEDIKKKADGGDTTPPRENDRLDVFVKLMNIILGESR